MNALKRLLRIQTVFGMVGRLRIAIYRDIQASTFPAVQPDARAIGRDSDDIAEWQTDRIAASSTIGSRPTKVREE